MISKYSGKLFSVLGDSISTLEGYNPPEYAVFYNWHNKCISGVFAPSDTWWGRVIDALGGQLLVNNSYSGSLVCKHPQCEIESYGCSDDRTGALGYNGTSPDVIMILMGLNDWGWGMKICSTGKEKGLDVFSEAYGIMLKKLRKNYPEAEIWCITLPIGRDVQNGECRRLSHGVDIRSYCDVIIACGKETECKIIDINTAGSYDTFDGNHPTFEGMRTIAESVLDVINTFN